MNSILLQSLAGRTIERVEIVKDEHENSWDYDTENEIILHFADGTSFLISAEAQHADALFLEIKKIDMTAEELMRSRKTEVEMRKIEKNRIEKDSYRESERYRREVRETNELIAQIVAETEEDM